MTLPANERDWKEDFDLDNGDYFNACAKCHETFRGYKRRVICKTCDSLSRSPRSCKRYTFCKAEYGSSCDCNEEKEREEFEKWWPSVGQTIGKAAAWEAWKQRGKLK